MENGNRKLLVSPKGSPKKSLRIAFALGSALLLILLFAKPGKPQAGLPIATIISPSKQTPVQTNLVSDIPGLATTQDANLIDPWGIANSKTSPYWISDQGTDRSTLYNGAGTASALVVEVPPVGTPSGPTGMIAVPSGTTGFVVPGGTSTAHFIFDTLDGTIAAWASGGTAVTTVTTSGAVYTGLAFANNGTANYLYAADFVSGGKIQVFDSTFAPATLTGSFADAGIPGSYAPFNIQALGNNLYVTYAQVSPAAGFPNAGSGLGYVDEFDSNGNLIAELVAANSALNAPWGLTMSPAAFTEFPNALLVGNFGNGEINAFDPTHGTFLGTLTDPEGRAIVNEGLWAIEFGNGNTGSSPNTLYITAGINGLQDGLFAAISPGPVTLAFPSQLVGTASTVQTITVENTGSAAMSLTAAPALSGTNSTDFAIGSSTCTNGASIPAGGACTIPITFTPAAAGARGPAMLIITDNASGGSQTVTLSGTGTNGAPAVSITPPTPVSFSGQIVSSTSTAQTVTIQNTGNAGLVFGAGAIGVSNDFAETDTCSGATIAVNSTCTVTVTFTPSSTTNNPRSGTLTITDNAAGSPQIVALSGTGWDFSVTSPATASVTRGMQGSVSVNVAASGGFTGTVALTCTASIPNGSCSVSPASVTAPGTATVNLTTAASAPPSNRNIPPFSRWQLLLILAAFASMCTATVARRRMRLAFAGAILLIAAIAVGCSSNSKPATPAGQYLVTVTGASGGVNRMANVTLTVSP